ncbi:MAG TPA: DUF3568 family protein [Lacunisphaera sp.]|nr:DUF3568 family protein [Lacunisphaera sp.]
MNFPRRLVTGFRAVVPLLVLGTIPFSSGCVAVVAAGAGAGAVAYVRGEMNTTVESDLGTVFASAQKTLADLEFAKINDHKSGVDALLVARTALDKRVEIKLTKVTDRLTKVQIRVGVMGDQDISLTILDKIKARL